MSKLPIECSIHGIFYQSMGGHLSRKGCPKCSGNFRLNTEEFIQRANLKHKNKYDYTKVIYFSSGLKIIIICPIHGEFLQTPTNHLRGQRCPKCRNDSTSKKQRGNIKEIIERANKLFKIPYNYSLIKQDDYKNNTTKLPIICPHCSKIFYQSMAHHLRGRGCVCQKHSKGELFISKILKSLDISFETQFSFKDCRDIRPLKFDFYISSLNVLIEYDGRQHFEVVNDFGGIEGFKIIEFHDNIKNKYCEDNNIPLIRIPYWLPLEEIEEILINDIS